MNGKGFARHCRQYLFMFLSAITPPRITRQHKCSNKFRYDNKWMQNNCISYLESF